MAKKQTEPKIILEREYIVPLRKGWLKVPKYKRANKAVKAIRQFLVRHMKIYDRDLKKVKIDILLNNELRFRGMRKPPAKIKVKARKFDNNLVKAELVEIPQVIKYKIEREKRKKEAAEKKKVKEEKPVEKKEEAEKEEEKPEEKALEEKVKEEKKEAVKEAGLLKAKQEAKKMKHLAGGKQKQPTFRKALEK